MNNIFMDLKYAAPPTCARFMKSESFMRVIAGPVGSGKTTSCIFEFLRRAIEQHKSPDGFRHTRFAIVRQTLSQLKMTVLKDIVSWLQGICAYRVSENTVYIEFEDIRSEWILIPLEDPEDQRRLLSSQLTGAWISEAIEIDADLVPAIAGRCGRYPSAAQGGTRWHGVIADTNMPAEGSDWHKYMALEVPYDWEIFIQPGGLEPNAENLEWLVQTPETLKLPPSDPRRRTQGRTYYERLSHSNGPDWIRRYVHAQYGDDPSGSAVYRESFKRSFHVVNEIIPVHGHPLIIGQDFGRDPWSVISQVDHKGRFLLLGEVSAEDVGLELHVTRSLKPALLDQRYTGRPVAIVGDPAGIAKSSIYEETSFDVLKRAGFAAFPAPTNDIDPRLRSIEAYLLQQRDGGPAMLIDGTRCPTVVRALDGGYRYGKTKAGLRKPLPEKNEFSHPIDALQYACLAAHGGMNTVIASKLRTRPRRNVTPPRGGWT